MDYRREVIATVAVNKGEEDEAVVMVGTFPTQGRIAWAISSVEDGDTEIYLRPDDCERVVEHLERALAQLRENSCD